MADENFYTIEYLQQQIAAVCKERDELKIELSSANAEIERLHKENFWLTNDDAKVVHGRWIYGGWRPKCSICGFGGSLYDTPTDPFNYCPNCGAKMDLEV